MIIGIRIKGFVGENEMSLKEDKKKLLVVSNVLLSKMMKNERDGVMLMLMSYFKRLRYEDLEEVYSDGCLKLWEKMVDDDFELMEDGMSSYLRKICKNIGMHYMRKKKDNVESLDSMMERGKECVDDSEKWGIGNVFDVMEEDGESEDEKYDRLSDVWE